MDSEGHGTWADVGKARGSEVCPVLPTPGLAAEDRGRGAVRAEEQWDSCEAEAREPALQVTDLGRPEERLVIAEAEIQPLNVDEVELELLRQFDLAWQFGPCTGEDPLRPQEHMLEPVLSPTYL